MMIPDVSRSTRVATQTWPPVVVAVLFMALFVVSAVRVYDFDIAALLRTGAIEPPSLEYVESRLGEVPTVPTAGHDGKHFFILAHDPLLLDPATHAVNLERPTYRAQRILYPLLVSPLGLFGPRGIVWGLLVMNLIAVGVGTWATARLAVFHGSSMWLGLSFGLNPGTIMEVLIDGSGVTAWALVMVSVAFLYQKRSWWAVGAMAAAVLSRETMILAAVGAAVFLWRRDRSTALRIFLVPLAVAAIWGIYVRVRLGASMLTFESREIGLPFEGLWQALQDWQVPSKDMVVGMAVVLLVGVCIYQAVARPALITWIAVGFALLAPLLTRNVWLGYYDISRAAMPLFTTVVLAMFLHPRAHVIPDTG